MDRHPARARLVTPRTRRLAIMLALVATGSARVSAPAPAAAASPSARAGKAGTLSPRLQVLATAASTRAAPRSPEAASRAVGLPAEGPDSLGQDPAGRIYVDVWGDSPGAVSAAAATPGSHLVAAGPDGRTATLAVPAAALAELGHLDGLRSAHEVPTPRLASADPGTSDPRDVPVMTSASTCPHGKTVTAADQVISAAAARAAYGVDGTGVKVGIISDSFAAHASAVAPEVAAGDLPGTGNPCGHTTPVQIVAEGSGTDEGRAMAQIVHDLAPGATLAFASAGASDIEMANHIRALRDAGAKVIVDDIGYADETIYQDGYIAAAVDEVVADGVAYYSSAGNANLEVAGKSVGSYETNVFRSMSCPSTLSEYVECHDFDPGPNQNYRDVIAIPPHGTLDLNMGWNEPMYGVDSDYDLFLLDDNNGTVLSESIGDNINSGQPVEWTYFENTSSSTRRVRLVVARYGQTGLSPRFKVVLNAYSLSAVQWNTTKGADTIGPTLYGHNGASGGATVAAITPSAAPSMRAYSSHGPATYCWAPAHGADVAPKLPSCQSKTVDVALPDGVATTVSGFETFFGTSAAAPHAAGIAALQVQHAPCASSAQLLTAMKAAGSFVVSDPNAAGAGEPYAPDAVGSLPSCAGVPATPPPPTITAVGTDAVSLTLHPPASTVGSPVTAYRVQVIRPGGAVVSTIEEGTSTQVVVPAPRGGAYRFRTQVVAGADSPWGLPSAAAVPPFSSVSSFIARQATDFAGRSLSPFERQLLTFLVGDDYGPAQAVLEGSLFDEWASKIDPVIRLYYAYFQRKPDAGGLTHWLSRRRAGISLNQVSSTFAASSEFNRTYGSLSNKAFVQLVYHNVLGRAGDSGGISYWTKQLDTKKRTRGQVMTGFSESSEHLRRRVGEYLTIDLWFGMLGRIPTDSELATWVPVAVDHVGATSLVTSILQSAEYLDRVT
jgi:hypothetical protein